MVKKSSVKALFWGAVITLALGTLALFSSGLVSRSGNKQEIRSHAAPATTVYFNPGQTSVLNGQSFSLTAVINPGTNTITAAELHIAFDPAKLTLNSITNSAVFNAILIPAQINNNNGTASVTLGTPALNPTAAVSNIAIFNFTAKSPVSSSSVSFASGTQASALHEQDNVIISMAPSLISVVTPTPSPSPSPTPSPSPSPTPTPTPLPTAVIKISLQKIMVQRPDEQVHIKLINAAGTTVFNNNYAFTSNSQGVYSTQIVNLAAGTYNLWIKPQTFLAKKFSVTLNSGAQTLDYTQTPFLAGDIVGENNIIDIFDYGHVVEDFGPKMPASGSSADMDKNGSVDIFDYGLIIENFGKTGDN